MHIDYTHITPHQSSREGASIKLAMLHTTEGSDNPHGEPPSDLVTLGAIFDGEEASANHGANVAGKMGLYVHDEAKAWAVCNYNSVAINLEQIGFADFTTHEWFRRHDQLAAAAVWLQYVHNHHRIPIRRGKVSNGAVIRTGVLQHKDLGLAGCGHVDCGPGYPQRYVMILARYYIAADRDPHSKTARKLKAKVNRIRKRFGVKPAP